VGYEPQNTFAASVAAWNLRPVSLRPRLRAQAEVSHRSQPGCERLCTPRADPGAFTRVSAFRLSVRRPPSGGGTGPKRPGPEHGTTGTL